MQAQTACVHAAAPDTVLTQRRTVASASLLLDADLKPYTLSPNIILTPQIEGVGGFSDLRLLELGSNRLRRIAGLDHMTGLRELWLGRNRIAAIDDGLSQCGVSPCRQCRICPRTRFQIIIVQPLGYAALSWQLAAEHSKDRNPGFVSDGCAGQHGGAVLWSTVGTVCLQG